jgi:hypothetical protein
MNKNEGLRRNASDVPIVTDTSPKTKIQKILERVSRRTEICIQQAAQLREFPIKFPGY